jgi:tetratricopeptide (TPR) repeat protein
MKEPDLTLIRHLRNHGKFAEAQVQLAQWMEKESDNPYLEFEMGLILDALNQLGEAIDFYRRALEHDPPNALKRRVLISLANDLRLRGQIYDSRQWLEQARKEFPHDMAIDLFYALSLWKDDDRGSAFRMLWTMILSEPAFKDLDPYRTTLRHYSYHFNDR